MKLFLIQDTSTGTFSTLFLAAVIPGLNYRHKFWLLILPKCHLWKSQHLNDDDNKKKNWALGEFLVGVEYVHTSNIY